MSVFAPVLGALWRQLEGYGVDCSLVRRYPDRRSSMSSIFIDKTGERMIVNFRDTDLPEECDWLPDLADLGVGAVLADRLQA